MEGRDSAYVYDLQTARTAAQRLQGLQSVSRVLYAIKANDPKLLTCGIEEGHLSSSLAHLANIAYRVGRKLKFDGKSEKFVGDAEADKLLTREYRAPFVVPEKV